jgi:hypothetical protein
LSILTVLPENLTTRETAAVRPSARRESASDAERLFEELEFVEVIASGRVVVVGSGVDDVISKDHSELVTLAPEWILLLMHVRQLMQRDGSLKRIGWLLLLGG